MIDAPPRPPCRRKRRRRLAATALALALAAGAAGCGGADELAYVRPWFRVATTPKHVIAPHAIEWGGRRHAEILVDGDWERLAHGDFRTHLLIDQAIAVDEYAFVDARRRDPMNDERDQGASGVFIYREGRAAPVHIPPARCATPAYSEGRAEITCFGCGDAEPFRRLDPSRRTDAPCGTLHVDTFDLGGKLVARRAFASPAKRLRVEGRLDSGPWILLDDEPPRGSMFTHGVPRRLQLDERGVTELTFGADPLHPESDHPQRAAEILKEIPIREAAFASLRAEFDDDERAHPTWVRRDEVATRLRMNVATEPDLPVGPGTCVTFVARATADLTRLEVSLHTKMPMVPVPIEQIQGGVMTFATGAGRVAITRCHTPGDPAVYHFRVGSRGGEGYVVARIYTYDAPR